MNDKGPAPSAQNNKVLLATAAITAASTIAVSFIGIVPQLRRSDQQDLIQLKQQFEELKQRPVATDDSGAGGSTKKLMIRGTVRSADGAQLLKGYDIYLLPEGNNLLTSKTDDSGKFTFLGVPDGVYSIIVRDSANGRSGKGLLDDASDEVQVIGARVQYHIGP